MSRLLFVYAFIIFAALSSCELPDKHGPEAIFTIQPRFGDSLTVFHFDASNSSDNYTDNFRLKVRWDIDSDGVWESGFTINKHFAFKFPKNGTYSISCEIHDDEKNVTTTTQLLQVAPVPRDSIFTDSRDGQKYKAVFLFDRWWMSQNLIYGVHLMEGDKASDNEIAEKYNYPYSSYDSVYGGYYTWNEATDYGRELENGICPEGWRLPVIEDLNRISGILYFTNNYFPYLAADQEFLLDLTLTGKYIHTAKTWHAQGSTGNFWMNHKQPFDKFVSWAHFGKAIHRNYASPYKPILLSDYNPLDTETVEWTNLWGNFTYQKVALPIRCIKDYEID